MNQSNTEITTRHQEIEAITLTEEEIKLAIWQAKHKKYNEEKNKDWWNDPDEKRKPKDDDSQRSEVQKSKSPAN